MRIVFVSGRQRFLVPLSSIVLSPDYRNLTVRPLRTCIYNYLGCGNSRWGIGGYVVLYFWWLNLTCRPILRQNDCLITWGWNQVCVDGAAKHPHLSVYFDLSQRVGGGGGVNTRPFYVLTLQRCFPNSLFELSSVCLFITYIVIIISILWLLKLVK